MSHLIKVNKVTKWELYLIVEIQVVKLAIGLEVLSVVIQGEVQVSAVAFYDHWVPVVVIQQAPTCHSGVTLNGSVLIAT